MVAGNKLTGSAPCFFCFRFNKVTGPVYEFINGGAISTDTVQARLVDRVGYFFDVRILFFKLGISTQRI